MPLTCRAIGGSESDSGREREGEGEGRRGVWGGLVVGHEMTWGERPKRERKQNLTK